jgi:tRNA A-37 threonylcarbamoyl transferase component Bud32
MAEAPRVLSDRYEVRSTLGRGGMAQVYRATDRVLGRTVAVKVLSRRFSEDRRFVARFRREAQASAGLNHPHVVSVFDTGSHDGVHYIVMEYVEGETLGAILARAGPLPLDRAARIAADVAEALESAHRQGLVHRDVKPGNVMIDRQGRVKVVDFGIARAAADDTLTQTGTVLGTASYLSPEQARGDRVDARSDVYSLGCVLYEMVTGRTPFAADTSVAMAFRHVNEEPRPPSELRPEVPARLDAVVMRALEKEPDRRFRSAAEMREALLATLSGAPASTTAGGDTEVMPAAPPAPAPPARRWWIAAGVVAVLLALLGIALLAGTGTSPREARREARREVRAQESPEPTQGPLSVAAAYEQLAATITDGVAAGEIDEKAGEELLKKADEATAAYQGGDLPGALGKLAELNQKTAEYVANGQVSEGRAVAIQDASNDLAVAMQAAPPSPVPTETGDEGDGSSGPGSSDPQGKAKGHDEGEGNGD